MAPKKKTAAKKKKKTTGSVSAVSLQQTLQEREKARKKMLEEMYK